MSAIRRPSLCTLAWAAAWAVAVWQPCSARPPGRQPDDRGVFAISIAGKTVGSEKFDIRSAQNKVEVKGEVEIRAEQGGRQTEFHSYPDLVLDPKLFPETYTWTQTAPRSSSLKINFLVSPATARYQILSGNTDLREFALPSDVVVLDDNVFSHYEILVARYLRTSKGKQTFRAFIPQEAMPGQLTVDESPEQEMEVAGRKLKGRNFIVTTDLSRIELWTDKAGHLEEASIPAVQLTAARE